MNMDNEDCDLESHLLKPLSIWCTEELPVMDIHTAAMIGSYETIAEAVKCGNGTSLSKQNANGWTPLMYACFGQHEDIVQLLVTEGVDVNASGKGGLSALMVAAKGYSEKIIEYLLVKSLKPLYTADDHGWTALFHAVKMGQEYSVKCLLHYGADVNAIELTNGLSVLMLAAANARKQLVQILLKAKADHTLVSFTGETALDIAMQCGNVCAAKLLQLTILIAICWVLEKR